jgi:hypothetical protein
LQDTREEAIGVSVFQAGDGQAKGCFGEREGEAENR